MIPLALTGASCADSAASEAEEAPPSTPAEIQRDVRDLEAALIPLGADAFSSDIGHWKQRRQGTLERLREGPRELGLALLDRLREDRPEERDDVLSGFLDVAAHTAPEEATPYLLELLASYEARIAVRTRAAEVLAEVAPAELTELLDPVLREHRPTKTWPPAERLLMAWCRAAERTGESRAELLGEIATSLYHDDSVRKRAVRELALVDDAFGRAALETVLVESTGNADLRRAAAQSLLAVAGKDACATLQRTLDNEADTNFQLFLADMVEKNCR